MLEHSELTRLPGLNTALYPPDGLEIKHGIRRNFARRVRSYDRHACMQRLMAQGLMAMAREELDRARRILEIGCGTGYLTALLRQTNREARLTALDLDGSMLDAARRRLGADEEVKWLMGDGEGPIHGEYDLIIANASFQWFTRPAATMVAYHRSLAPGGILSFSTLGPETFQELAGALAQAAASLKLPNPPQIPAQGFGDRERWADHLSQAGFRHLKLARELVTTTFPSVREFLKALQATGATNPQPARFSPRLLTTMIAAYQTRYGKDGAIPVSYEIIWAIAQK
jgi:malonyl-CoA O-methyltransferase